MSNENYVLNEINKGIKMGMDSISNVSQKVQDDRFKQDLKCQYDKYNQILNNVNDELSNYDAFPKELPGCFEPGAGFPPAGLERPARSRRQSPDWSAALAGRSG